MLKKLSYKNLLKKLQKHGKLELSTKSGRNLSKKKVLLEMGSGNVIVNGSKKKSLCKWLKSRHKKRIRKGSKKRGGGGNQTNRHNKHEIPDGSLLDLERLIVNRLESVGVPTQSLK